MTKEATTKIVNLCYGVAMLVFKKSEFKTLGVGIFVLGRDQIHHKVKMRIEETKWRFLII